MAAAEKIKIDHNTGLVLEGGGMRGVFTSGVLDAMMKHGVWFRYVVAVSAGACNGMSYMSRQIRRARISNIDMLAQYDYIGLKHLLKEGNIFDRQLLYEEFPDRLVPYDWEAYFNNDAEFEVVATNCRTGRAEYLSEHHDKQRLTDIVKASSALPYVCTPVEVDGSPMLDGGIVDSIPVMRAVETGHSFNVVVATRNLGYRSNERDLQNLVRGRVSEGRLSLPAIAHDIRLPRFIYDEFPRLRVALSRRVEAYNAQLELIERMERWGEIVVIRPEAPVEVGRMERDINKLERLYEEGFRLGERFCLGLKKQDGPW